MYTVGIVFEFYTVPLKRGCIELKYYADASIAESIHTTISESIHTTPNSMQGLFKEGLYRIWCVVNRLGDSGVHTLGDISAFVNPAGQLLLTRRGKTRIDGVGIVFEFYLAPL